MKPIIITLLYLNTFGEIKKESFEIASGESCSTWYHSNVRIIEKKQRKLFSNLYYHDYKGKQVIGYICEGDEPK